MRSVGRKLVQTAMGVLVACQAASPPVAQPDPPIAMSPPRTVLSSEDDKAYRDSLRILYDKRPVVLGDVVEVLGRKPSSCGPRGKWQAIICEWVFVTADGPKRVDAYLLKATSDPSDLGTPLAGVAWPDEPKDSGAPW